MAANNQTAVTFLVHTGGSTLQTERQAQLDLVGANKQSQILNDFWVVYQIGAYQPGFTAEFDPNSGGVASGGSSQFSLASTDAQAGTVVFAEAAREQAENFPQNTISVGSLEQAVSIHEIAHEFGLLDGLQHGLLMDASTIGGAGTQSQLDQLQWNGSGLRLIMLTLRPGHSPH